MPFKKSEEEKAQKRANRAANAYAASPTGRAEAAFERGDSFFEIQLDVDRDGPSWSNLLPAALSAVIPGKKNKGPEPRESTDILGDIERVGWLLEHVGYVYAADVSSSGSDDSHSIATSGRTVGIYLFRRRAEQ